MKKNKKIKCDVDNCIHNDNECNNCELDEIKVTCNCDHDDACKKETICDSYEKNEDNSSIEDEYEAGREYYEEVEDEEE